MSIKLKLTLGLVTVILFTCVLGFYALLIQDHLGQEMTRLERVSEKRKLVADLQLTTQKLLMPANDYIITGKQSYRDDFERLAEEAVGVYQAIRDNLTFTPEEMASVDRSYGLLQQVREAGEAIFKLSHRDPRQPDLMEVMDYKYADPMIKELHGLNERTKIAFQKAQQEATKDRQLSRSNIITAIIFMTVALIVAGLLQRRSISRGLDSLAAIMNEIADGKGDLTKRIPIESNDELGMLAHSFNRFIDQVQKMMLEVRAVATEVSGSAEEIAAVSSDVQKATSRQSSAIAGTSQATEYLNQAISGIAEDAGRLLQLSSSAASSSYEISESIASIATLADNLDAVSDAALSSVNEITVSFKQVADSMKDLSYRADSVAASAVQINAAARNIQVYAQEQADMAGAIKDEASSAGLHTVRKTRESMERIREEVTAAAETIGRLGRVSSHINRIISMIDEITEKTKMLALNATILAAQAGAKGKGFGVVAQEVKALAQQTAQSTDEISSMIKQVQEGTSIAISATNRSCEEVEAGVRLSMDAEMVLTTIIEKTEGSVHKAMKVVQATDEQTTGVSVVTEAIRQIQQMIGQINTAVSEQKKASEGILAASEGVHACSTETKQNIAIQSNEIQEIARLFQEMHAKLQVIVEATVEQQNASNEIVAALDTVNQQAEENMKLANGLDGVVSSLEQQSNLLGAKISTFRI